MKVGTDGVLLGAWASLESNPQSILDIGAGTGLIALMLAQRSQVIPMAIGIDALEIEENAYEQCVENFENSPWNDRLFCFHASLEEFTEEMIDEKYDFIVSNPPFYTNDYQSSNTNRNLARFAGAMPFEELISSVSKLLSEKGEFAVIIPFSEEEKFIRLAEKNTLFPHRITRVRGTETSEIKRSLLQFSFQKKAIVKNELVLEIKRHQYTDEYKSLVEDFYLKL